MSRMTTKNSTTMVIPSAIVDGTAEDFVFYASFNMALSGEPRSDILSVNFASRSNIIRNILI